MLCRAGRIVLIKASFAEIDANLIALSAFTANRLSILSLGDGGREKQPRWSVQMWGGNVRLLWVLCPLHTASREHRTVFGEAACCIVGVQCPFTLRFPSKGKPGWQCGCGRGASVIVWLSFVKASSNLPALYIINLASVLCIQKWLVV